jgi:hypothetical protein
MEGGILIKPVCFRQIFTNIFCMSLYNHSLISRRLMLCINYMHLLYALIICINVMHMGYVFC